MHRFVARYTVEETPAGRRAVPRPGPHAGVPVLRAAVEIDGADAARTFLAELGAPEAAGDTVWQAVALHTTPEIPWHIRPEVALVTAGVEVDVLGLGFDEVDGASREQIAAAFPRPRFKEQIVDAFYRGIAHRPDTAFGDVKAHVLAHKDPSYRRPDFVDVIQNSAWPE